MASTTLAISLNSAQQIIIKYIDTGVFVFGTAGSLMNILLFSRSNLRLNSCCIYFFASSFAALVLLSIGIIPLVYAQFNSPNPFFSVNAFCKIRAYLNQWSAMSCRWLLVMACMDRCFACSISANIRHFLNVNLAYRIALSIGVIWMIFPVHTLFFANITSSGNPGCIILNNGVAIYHGLYTIIMGGALPSLSMIICTLFIWRNLNKKKERRAMNNMNRLERKNDIRDQQALILLFGQVAIFIISTIPFMSNNLYTAFTRDIPNKSVDRRAIESFAQVMTELFVYLFPASSFYSNTLVSRKFRKELIITLKWFTRFCRHEQLRVMPHVEAQTNCATNNMTMKIVENIQI